MSDKPKPKTLREKMLENNMWRRRRDRYLRDQHRKRPYKPRKQCRKKYLELEETNHD